MASTVCDRAAARLRKRGGKGSWAVAVLVAVVAAATYEKLCCSSERKENHSRSRGEGSHCRRLRVATVSGYRDDSDEDKEYTSSVTDATEGIAIRDIRKRSLSGERDDDDDVVEIVAGGRDDHHHPPPLPAAKKPRFVWTYERHQQFLDAVTQLGNKAVPKKILELMNIPGLTRENVASHLQKFRLHMEKESKATQDQNGTLNGTTVQPNNRLDSSTIFSTQALANADASRHVSPQAEALGFHAAGNTWSMPENHYPYSINESSQQAAYGGTYTTAAPKHDDSNNNIPCAYQTLMAVEDASPSSGYVPWERPSVTSPCRFFQHHNDDELMNLMAMHTQQHSHSNNESSQHVAYGGTHTTAAPKYDSNISSSNNNNIPYPYYPNDELMNFMAMHTISNTHHQQYYSSSSLSNSAELHCYANPQVLASHPTLSSVTQQQQLHEAPLGDADTMKEVPNAINSKDVDHLI